MDALKRRAIEGNNGTDRALPVPVPFAIPPTQEEQGPFMQLLLGEEEDE